MSRKKNRKGTRTTPGSAQASAYYLRGIPPDLWELVMAKARTEGRNIRWVILHALRDWLDGLYEPAQKEANPDAPRAGAGPALTRPSGERVATFNPRAPVPGTFERT
mgnify:CR=1 FL=1